MRIKKVSQTTPVQAEVVNTYSTSQENTYSCDYVNKAFGGTILWTNSSPSTAISTTTISNIDMTPYDMITIAFRQYNSNEPLTFATFKKDISKPVVLSYMEVGSGFWVIRSRTLELTNNTSISVQQGYQTVTGATPASSSNVCIPVYIIGYKTGLFN